MKVVNSAGQIKAPAVSGGGGGSVNFSAGTASANLTNVVFSNSNGVSFGLNGSTITGSIGALSGFVPYTGATTRLDLGTNFLSGVQGVLFTPVISPVPPP